MRQSSIAGYSTVYSIESVFMVELLRQFSIESVLMVGLPRQFTIEFVFVSIGEAISFVIRFDYRGYLV